MGMTPETRKRIERATRKVAAGKTAATERDAAIRDARSEGASLRQIADVAAMTPMAVRKIILKENTP